MLIKNFGEPGNSGKVGKAERSLNRSLIKKISFCAISIFLEQLSVGHFWFSFPWGGLLGYALHAGLVLTVSRVGMWIGILTLASLGAVLLRVKFDFSQVKLPPVPVLKKVAAVLPAPIAPKAPEGPQQPF